MIDYPMRARRGNEDVPPMNQCVTIEYIYYCIVVESSLLYYYYYYYYPHHHHHHHQSSSDVLSSFIIIISALINNHHCRTERPTDHALLHQQRRLHCYVFEAENTRDRAGNAALGNTAGVRCRKQAPTRIYRTIRRRKLTRVADKFLDDLPKMMYGFGDVPEPFQESKELLNQMIEEYIKSFVNDAMAGKVDKKLSPSMLKFRIKNPQKRKRIDEPLMMNEELRDAKALSVSE